VEDTQNHNPVAVVSVLKHVRAAENLHHDPPVFLPRCEWKPSNFAAIRNVSDFWQS
jgi:hypothetical protein